MDIALRLGTAARRPGRMRAAAVMVGACAQLAWAGCWAAEEPPATCKVELTDSEIAVSTQADTKDEKLSEILDKIEKKLPDAFAINRHDDLKRIVKGIVREMLDRDKVVLTDLNKGITAACTALQVENSQSFAAATAAGFKAAGLPAPPTYSADFATGGSDDAGSKFAFMTGVVNSLEADGSWKSAVEASFISRTQFSGPPLTSLEARRADAAEQREEGGASGLSFNPFKAVGEPRVFGRFEVTWSAIGKIDEEQSDTATTPNPFAAGGGILRVNLGPEFVGGQGWWGLTTGCGLTTQPDTEDDPADPEDNDVDARRRWYAGVLFLADYGSSKDNAERVTGRIAIGYTDDKFWEWKQTVGVAADGTPITMDRDESKRWFLDARIDGPGVFQSDSVKLSLRMYVDHPKSGDGPTDVRVSLLVTADLGLLFGK